MRITESFQEELPETDLKTVNYFGMVISIYVDHHYIATDEDGMVVSYAEKPIIDPVRCEGMWVCPEETMNDDHNPVVMVDLEGTDWKDTLVCV